MTESLEDEIYEIITTRVLGHERSQQVQIGASGLGTPCIRKLGFRLAEVPPVSEPSPAWRPTVGTAIHEWLRSMLDSLPDGQHITEPDGSVGNFCCTEPWCDAEFNPAVQRGEPVMTVRPHVRRFATELRTPIGTINDRTIYGTVDVYDRLTKTVIDWKTCGPGKLKDYRTAVNRGEVPSAEYRVQIHAYGRGISRAQGLPVEHVALCFLPMNGELREMLWWSEPYDPEIGRAAFERARLLDTKLRMDSSILTRLKRANDYCQHCDWFSPTEPASETSCPGAIESAPTPDVAALLA